MSDRINIAALRHDAEIEAGREDGDCLLPQLQYTEGVLALVEAVETAQAHVVARRDKLPSEWPRLLTALARFDFEDET